MITNNNTTMMDAYEIQQALYVPRVVFDKESHTYRLDGYFLSGVTSTIIPHILGNKYEGISEEVLKNAAKRGTKVHDAIEEYNRSQTLTSGVPELGHYIDLMTENNLTCIAAEYIVSDEEDFASAVDCVAVNAENEICLIDYKTTAQLDRQSLSLQLSLYKYWFERAHKKVGLKVEHIYGMWLRGDTRELVEVPVIGAREIRAMIKATLDGTPYTFVNAPRNFNKMQAKYLKIAAKIAALEAEQAELKMEIQDAMNEGNYKSVTTDRMSVCITPAHTTQRFDTTSFKKDNADLYEKYLKEGSVKESIKFTIK